MPADLLEFHRMLLNDRERMTAYRRAIQRAVRPDDVVLDAGAGTGILALFACQAGARRVYAIDREDILFVARQIAEASGFADRIVFLQEEIRAVNLPEPVDLIVSELISKGVIGQRMAETVGWCRDHFLKPGGRVLPEKVDLLLAPVESEESYRRLHLPVRAEYGIDFAPIERRSLHWAGSARFSPAAQLAPAQAAFEYRALSSVATARVDATLTFCAQRAGSLHGFGGWFSSVLTEDIVLTNAPPGLPSWDNLFLPLPEPVAVREGESIAVRLRGWDDVQASGAWSWETVVGQDERPVATFRQSSLLGQIVSPKALRVAAAAGNRR